MSLEKLIHTGYCRLALIILISVGACSDIFCESLLAPPSEVKLKGLDPDQPRFGSKKTTVFEGIEGISRLLPRSLFSEKEISTIISRVLELKGLLNNLTPESKRILFNPDILPVILGIKPAYLRYGGESPTQPLVDELNALNVVWVKEEICEKSNSLLISKPNLFNRLEVEGDYLVKNGILFNIQLQKIISRKDIKVFIRYFEKLYVKNNGKIDYLVGFMLGYPLYDIDYALKLYFKGEIKKGLDIYNDYRHGLKSCGGSETTLMLNRLSAVLDFAYNAFSSVCDLKEHLLRNVYEAYSRNKVRFNNYMNHGAIQTSQ
ncbi:MAG: hypothetical protein ABII27_08715 [bacterium]